MKKVSLILLLVIVLSTVLMAQVPTKMVRLTVINKSGDDVFIKLNGSTVSDPPFFYYLTIPVGDTDAPTIKVFTIMSDVYSRETWSCNDFRTAGTLIVTGNLRLVFTPCGQVKELPCQYLVFTQGGNYRVARASVVGPDCSVLGAYEIALTRGTGEDADLLRGGAMNYIPVLDPVTGLEVAPLYADAIRRNAGEPTMEKVVAFRQILSGDPAWASVTDYAGYWSTGCATFFYRTRTWRTPVGCAWRYQY